MNEIQLRVSGMSCSACEERIQKALARVEGILRSSADHRAGQVRVVLDPARASEQSVRVCIERAGYGVLP
jgi:copper chaperone CopZ